MKKSRSGNAVATKALAGVWVKATMRRPPLTADVALDRQAWVRIFVVLVWVATPLTIGASLVLGQPISPFFLVGLSTALILFRSWIDWRRYGVAIGWFYVGGVFCSLGLVAPEVIGPVLLMAGCGCWFCLAALFMRPFVVRMANWANWNKS